MTEPILLSLHMTVAEAARLPSKPLSALLHFLFRWEGYADALAILDAQGPSPLVSVYDMRASALAGSGRHDEAVAVMAERLELCESNSAWLHLARVHLLGGDIAGAFAVANRLVHQPDSPVPAWHLLGDVLLRQEDLNAAEAAYLRCLKLSPDNRSALTGLAELHLRRRQPVQAAAYGVRAYTAEEGQSGPSVDLLRRLIAFFAASGDANRLAEAEAQLGERFGAELAAMHELLDGEAGTAEAPKPPAARAGRKGERPARPHDAAGAPPPAALPDLASVPVGEEERRDLLAAAERIFGFTELLPAQAEIMACARRGEPVLAVLPTGAGKSLCYQLPALMDPGLTLVISPLIALMKDQVDNLPEAVRQQAIAINSSMDGRDLRQALADLRRRQYRLVYAAPERLRQPPFVHALAEVGLTRLVIDEAHCVSIWGHDFRPDYLNIAQAACDLGNPPILALTATAPPRVRQDILNRLFSPGGSGTGRPPARLIMTDTYRPNLHLSALQVRDDDEKLTRLAAFCDRLEGSGIVYVPTRRRAEELAQMLERRGVAAAFYHAGLEQPARAQVQDGFMAGQVRVIVATVAFGMGIDKPDIRFIIHYGLPDSVESYYQEAGRAGRDGRPAQCILLYSAGDRSTLARHANEGVMPIDFLRQVYAAAGRRLKRRNPGTVPLVELMVDVGGEETAVRVALSILEQTGLLTRFGDTPTIVGLWLNQAARSGDPVLNRVQAVLAEAGGAIAGRDFLALAVQTGIAPNDLERKLLAWQSAGYLDYQPGSRDLLLGLPPAPGDAALRIESLLSQYTAIQQQRVTEIWDFARTARCRHGHLSSYLGGERRERCEACDNCLPDGDPAPGEPDDPGAAAAATTGALAAILGALAGHGWGRRNLTLLLRGDSQAAGRGQNAAGFGMLSHRSESAIGKMIDLLLSMGYIEQKTLDHGGVALGITPDGRRALSDQALLAALVKPRPPVRKSWGEVETRVAKAAGDQRLARPDSAGEKRPAGPLLPQPVDAPPEVADRYERLRAWRIGLAREQGVSAFVIASNALLLAIAGAGPRTLQDLAAVPGMGPARLEKYGAAILQILAAA